ncbi:unnamed protein product [Prunus armeniaca]
MEGGGHGGMGGEEKLGGEGGWVGSRGEKYRRGRWRKGLWGWGIGLGVERSWGKGRRRKPPGGWVRG